MNVALAWRPTKGSGADLAMHMQRTVLWKRVQRVLTHPDVEKALKLKLGIDVPVRFREFFFVRELPGHSLGVHTGNNGKKVRAQRFERIPVPRREDRDSAHAGSARIPQTAVVVVL